ncbi:MAG TPA: hypothetical protein VHW64_01580 [Nocardioides sp.]|uniref:hypothetical protein n=1 Tax=Nocardioides sp. TaxID=35761 RepID=UPI002E2FD045|nr:hypothetical protein [Nocardioides sp.]HEX3929364.1 hypothetical protein [Nocardioides sp.]
MRAATASRLAVGSACLVVPRQALALLGAADRDDPVVAAVARVLGVRLLVQAGVESLLGGQAAGRARWLGAAVDLAHAASMLPVAHRWPEHRRSALVSAAAATATAALDLASRRDGSEGVTRRVGADLNGYMERRGAGTG